MSVAEELHRVVDELSKEQQQELLEVARGLFSEQPTAEEDNLEYQAVLKGLLIKRYEKHKANPQRALSLDQLTERMNQKDGQQF